MIHAHAVRAKNLKNVTVNKMKIIVASKNPVKLNAVKRGFKKMFPNESLEIDGVSVPSGVSSQPMSNNETFLGALNRSKKARINSLEADFWIGIEGGCENNKNELEAFAWVIVLSKNGKIGKGRTSTFYLPKKICALIKKGKELGEADDIVFGQTNSKQKHGTVGNLTGNIIDRTKFYTEAVILALIPFRNTDLY